MSFLYCFTHGRNVQDCRRADIWDGCDTVGPAERHAEEDAAFAEFAAYEGQSMYPVNDAGDGGG